MVKDNGGAPAAATTESPAPISEPPIPPSEPSATTLSSNPVVESDVVQTESAPPPPPKPVVYAESQAKPVRALRPNSSIPKFLQTLGVVIFFAGSAATILAYVYQTIIYPKLVITLAAKVKLQEKHTELYGLFMDKLRSLRTATKTLYLTDEQLDHHYENVRLDREKRAEEKERLKAEAPPPLPDRPDRPPQEKIEELVAEEEVEDTMPLPPAPQILTPLSGTLSVLAESLNIPSAPTPPFFDPTTPISHPDKLEASLAKLNTFLSAEIIHACSTIGVLRNTANSGRGGRKEYERDEVLKNIKTEIRSLKGGLLGRRNFAQRPSPKGTGTSTPA